MENNYTKRASSIDDLRCTFMGLDEIETLRISQRSLLAAQRIALLGSWEWDLSSTILACSPEMCRMFEIGLDTGFMEIAELLARIHPVDLPAVIDALRYLREGDVLIPVIEFRIVQPSGGTIWVRSFTQLLADAPGARMANGAMLDVTDLKITERERALTEQELRQNNELASVGGTRYDAVSRRYSMPPETRKLLGLGDDYASFDARKGRQLIHPDDWHMMDGRARNLIAGGVDRQQSTYRFMSPSKGMLQVQTINEAVRDLDGSLIALIGVIQDVTALRDAESEGRNARKKAEQFLDIAGTVILAVGVDGKIDLINRRGRELIGYSAPELTATNWFDLAVPEASRESAREMFAKMMRRPDGRYHTNEWPMIVRNGDQRLMEWVSTALIDGEGRATGLLASGRDLTDLRKVEAQLRQAQKLEAVGQLTGGIAHDFNNLLTVIMGNADALVEEAQDNAGLKHMAEMIVNAADRAAQLTHRLLAFSRTQALQPRRADINQLVIGLENLMVRTLGAAIDLVFVGADSLWEATVDQSQLENAILNLAINARDAMPDGGHLTVETNNVVLDDDYVERTLGALPGQYVMVAVSDTGTGMPQDVVDKAFEPFFTTKELGAGSGLGLSMVYGFVKQSGGHVRIYSEVGHGTSVKLYLPRSMGAAAVSHKVLRAAGTLPRGTESVAVVEDNELVRTFIASTLRELGYQVRVFGNGPLLLQTMRNGYEFDMLLTDIVLPAGMSGGTLARNVRAMRPASKTLFVSGFSENALNHQGRRYEAPHLLHKPFHKTDLAIKMRHVLDAG